MRVKFDPPKRNPPRQIVLTLPKSRPLIGSLSGVQLVERSDQKKRWDFPTMVAQYRETCDWTKPNAVSLSTGKPATCSHALPNFDAPLANDGRSDDTDSYWATDVEKHPSDAWWQVDLEKPTTIGRVVVVGYFGDQRHYGFTVETSLDGLDVGHGRRLAREQEAVDAGGIHLPLRAARGALCARHADTELVQYRSASRGGHGLRTLIVAVGRIANPSVFSWTDCQSVLREFRRAVTTPSIGSG